MVQTGPVILENEAIEGLIGGIRNKGEGTM